MKHRAATAGWLSVICAGLGQLYNRQYVKGLSFILVYAAGIYAIAAKLTPHLKGIVTLGEQGQHLVKVGKIYKNVPGDHSIFMMIYGVLAILVVLLFLLFYVLNIRDAVVVGRRKQSGSELRVLNSSVFPWLLLSVPMIGVLFFTIMPIVFTSLIAFTNYASPNHIPPKNLVDWVGFATFDKLFNMNVWSDTFVGVLSWTIVWAILATVTCYFGGILVALLINQQGIRFKGIWRMLFIIPYAIPQFVSLLIMKNLLNEKFGPINQYFRYFGMEGLPWLNDPFWAKVSVIVVNMWIGIPVSMILVMGILTTIPKDLYEAADVDGATAGAKFRNITMPYILFATAPILITQFVGNINNFNVIFLLTGGNPATMKYNNAGETDLLVTWLYKLTLDFNQYNIAAAVSILIFLFIAAAAIVMFRRTRSFNEEDMIQ
ncbi:sugar ABC transporter permease [Cohnella sp. CIP 111063]|uniref:carbohydrate ABC transporter permease n=1 Tax=unclassified Cohnella TaxID=2636738 RepID=UPI000B8BC9A6|nr:MULTISPECIES: sugar ABC transporter permease [unclassified Cohnella]OXS55628.1 sugar ABC transporter permease [Cohnella sp. CIP 111063]PRX66474.1 carbohydrate ABC transporter membrane protein 1 (CUT1 family) [Cohnella sp. SGD-V74]